MRTHTASPSGSAATAVTRIHQSGICIMAPHAKRADVVGRVSTSRCARTRAPKRKGLWLALARGGLPADAAHEGATHDSHVPKHWVRHFVDQVEAPLSAERADFSGVGRLSGLLEGGDALLEFGNLRRRVFQIVPPAQPIQSCKNVGDNGHG